MNHGSVAFSWFSHFAWIGLKTKMAEKKRIMLLVSVAFFSGGLYAQTNTFPASGNVGVGTSTPSALFHMRTTKFGIKTNLSSAILESKDAQLDLISGSDDRWGSAINFVEGDGTSNVDVWSIARQTTNGVGDSSLRFNFGSVNQHDNPNKMTLTSSGNLGLGTQNPTSKLEVNGTIKTKEVNVTTSGWADYVFNPDYDLMPLSELADFVHKNGHLPDVPTEAEVLENGVNLAEMNVKLLEKVEELTLYLIEERAINTKQQELLVEQQKELERLSALLDKNEKR